MKKIVVIIIVAFCVVYLVSAPILSGFKNVVDEKNREDIFVELWHIDTFEGGKNSRGEFLKAVAVSLNKSNKNEFIVVKTITEMELEERLKLGQLPEMFSFGTGLGEVLKGYLTECTVGTGQRGFLDECVTVDGKTLATPFAFGGYFEIGKGNPIIYATGTVLAPILARYFEGENGGIENSGLENTNGVIENSGLENTNGGIENSGLENTNGGIVEKATTYEAYLEFIERGGTLIGTQRDVVRVCQRVENGKMNDVEIKPLTRYTDMVMAVGLTENASEKKRAVCEKYIEFLLSESVQSRLYELRMFPSRNMNVYSMPFFSDYEKDIDKMRCANIFTPTELLKKNSQLGINAMQGKEKDKKFLDDFFIAR